MKKIFVLMAMAIVSLGLTGCFTPRYVESSAILYYNNFKNFFISESNSVSFEYKPVGNVSAIVKSGFIKRKWSLASEEDALRLLYDEAKRNKANGIINLKISYGWQYDKNGKIMLLRDIVATGMAIRIY
jgi:hypothetical protein